MRVYEYSKKSGIATKELLTRLERLGFVLPSHMSVIPSEALALLEKPAPSRAPSPATSSRVAANAAPSTTPNKSAALQQKPAPKEPALQQVRHEKKSQVAVASKKQSPQQKNQQRSQRNRPSSGSFNRPVAPRPTEEVRPALATEIIVQSMTIAEFSERTGRPVGEVILLLLKKGVVVAKNKLIDEKIVTQLAGAYGLKTSTPEKQVSRIIVAADSGSSSSGELVPRAPVVVIIGHVDHGKTTLLDFIRKTRVAAREKGGITQHLGAYEAKTAHGTVVFLDTPGHEAFSMMRERGVRIADIAVLMVAADDGVMPQTIEAIKIAKAVSLPIVVAINKIDKAAAQQVENVKKMLASYDLVPEEWGGQAIMMPISAKTGKGVDELLDVIVLQSQIMDLKASVTALPLGYVLESRLEKGLGPVATVIMRHGTLRIGDSFVSGSVYGKISSLVDSAGRRVKEVLPAIPVLVAGFSEVAQAGDSFEVVPVEEFKKARIRLESRLAEARSATQQRQLQAGQTLNLLVKVDGVSSREALLDSIAKMAGKTYKQVSIVHAGVGPILESDIRLAQDTGSVIYALHVKMSQVAQALAQQLGVTVKLFDIIYKLLEELHESADQGRPVKMLTKKIGEASVLRVFPIKNLGVIAGSHVKSGRFVKDAKVVVWRGKQKVGEGKLTSLQRDKKVVKEVHAGFECGILVSSITDWQADDRVECFIDTPDESV